MMKAIPVLAALAIAAAAPALAQEYRYPSDTETTTTTSPDGTSTTTQSREDWESDQQARTPDADREATGTVETLRDRHMSSPNVQGEAVPEQPGTGVPRPGASPDSLESTPRP